MMPESKSLTIQINLDSIWFDDTTIAEILREEIHSKVRSAIRAELKKQETIIRRMAETAVRKARFGIRVDGEAF